MRYLRICLAILLGWGLGCAPELQEATLQDAWNYQKEQEACISDPGNKTRDQVDDCRRASWEKCDTTFLDRCPAAYPNIAPRPHE